LNGFFQHRIEHRREIAGRGIDDLEDLGRRGLPSLGFVALGGALIEAPLQFGICARRSLASSPMVAVIR
jgi:hypothetical protein